MQQSPYMAGSPRGEQYFPVVPMGAPRGAPRPREDVPHFDPQTGNLKIPAAATGGRPIEFPAAPVGSSTYDDAQFREKVREEIRKAIVETKDEKSQQPTVVETIREQIEVHAQQDREKFNNLWFELKPNTFSTAIWVLLVLDFDQTAGALFEDRNSEYVPHRQRWSLFGKSYKDENGKTRVNKQEPGYLDKLYWPIGWWRHRFWPYLSAILFQLVAFVLFAAVVLIQIGFTSLLYMSLETEPDFEADDKGVEYICATTGWLQAVSIGFFCAYMLGEVPRLLKNFVLIWWSDYETTEDRGMEKCKMLWAKPEDIDKEERKGYSGAKDIDKKQTTAKDVGEEERKGYEGTKVENSGDDNSGDEKYHNRGYWNMFARRFVASLVNLCDMTVTGFVLYVGVHYIFWSGYKSMDPVLDPVSQDSGPFNQTSFDANDGFPWMSNTQGIEEVIMATVALVFIMDIDEYLFVFLLPRSVQQVVAECRLSSVMWMPAKFELDDFRQLGLPIDHSYDLFKEFQKEFQKNNFDSKGSSKLHKFDGGSSKLEQPLPLACVVHNFEEWYEYYERESGIKGNNEDGEKKAENKCYEVEHWAEDEEKWCRLARDRIPRPLY